MIHIPKPHEIAKIEGLLPIDTMIDKLIENIKGTEKHARGSVMTVNYRARWDENHDAIELSVMVKSKRPTRTDRNEEFLGEEIILCHFRDEDAAQQRLDRPEKN